MFPGGVIKPQVKLPPVITIGYVNRDRFLAGGEGVSVDIEFITVGRVGGGWNRCIGWRAGQGRGRCDGGGKGQGTGEGESGRAS